jgi:hypothetical protein
MACPDCRPGRPLHDRARARPRPSDPPGARVVHEGDEKTRGDAPQKAAPPEGAVLTHSLLVFLDIRDPAYHARPGSLPFAAASRERSGCGPYLAVRDGPMVLPPLQFGLHSFTGCEQLQLNETTPDVGLLLDILFIRNGSLDWAGWPSTSATMPVTMRCMLLVGRLRADHRHRIPASRDEGEYPPSKSAIVTVGAPVVYAALISRVTCWFPRPISPLRIPNWPRLRAALGRPFLIASAKWTQIASGARRPNSAASGLSLNSAIPASCGERSPHS